MTLEFFTMLLLLGSRDKERDGRAAIQDVGPEPAT